MSNSLLKDQLTIAVPNFNGMAVLAATLKAAQEAGEGSLPMIVVDDGSTDGSPEWVRRQYPDIQILSMGENTKSPNKVRNRALKAATTPYVMLIDNDILIDRASLLELFRVVTSRDDVLCCTPRILYYPEPPDTIYHDGGRLHYLGFAGNLKRGQSAKEHPPGPPRPTLGCGIMMVNRKLAEEVGYIDEDYPVGVSDMEFHVRGRLYGFQVWQVSTATAFHVERPHGKDRAFAQVTNRYRMIASFYSARTLLLLSPALLTFEVILTLLMAARGMLKERFLAIWIAWKDRKKLLQTRKRLQRCRKISDVDYLEGEELVPMGSAAKSRLMVFGSSLLSPLFRTYWRVVRKALSQPTTTMPQQPVNEGRAAQLPRPVSPAVNAPINVLYMAFTSGPARAANRLQSIRVCYFMARAGLRVHLHLASSFFTDRKQMLDYFGFEEEPNFLIYLYPAPNLGILERLHPLGWYLKRLLAMIITGENRNYDVFFARGRFTALNILLKPLLGHKVLFEFHEIMYLSEVSEAELHRKRRLLDVERFVFKRADGVVSISRTLLEFGEARWGKRSNTTVIPSGAVTFESEPLPEQRPIRQLFFVGNFYPYSGVDDVVRALALVPEVTLTIVGGGGNEDPELRKVQKLIEKRAGGGNEDRDRSRVQRLVEELGLTQRVIFRGYVEPNKLPSVYAEADIVLMPYTNHVRPKYFASPLKLFEYMSSRRPIIASNHPTIREILTDGENALLVEPENPQSIAAAIRRLIADPVLSSRIAEQAYKDVLRYTMANKCAGIAEFIRLQLVTPEVSLGYHPRAAEMR